MATIGVPQPHKNLGFGISLIKNAASSIYVNWVLVTLAYWIIVTGTNNLSPNNVSFLSTLGGFLGLFVPFGPTNFIFIIFTLGIPLGILLVAFLVYELVFRKWRVNLWVKVLVNFVLLLVITMIIDWMWFNQWRSWEIFINGYIDPSYTRF